jgi:hypothetical protein
MLFHVAIPPSGCAFNLLAIYLIFMIHITLMLPCGSSEARPTETAAPVA